MSDSHHSDSARNLYDLFPAKEWESFKQQDTQAGRAIVIIMQGIFVIGIVLYTIVAATL